MKKRIVVISIFVVVLLISLIKIYEYNQICHRRDIIEAKSRI